MSIMNLGSIAVTVLARFPDCSPATSGQMLQIVDEQRLYMEERTGLSIGSVGIAERFQPALISLSLANSMQLSKLDGANVASLSLGDFSVVHNGNDDMAQVAEAMKQLGEEQLRRLGKGTRFRRAIGGC